MINIKPILGVLGKVGVKEEEHSMRDFAEEGLKTVGEHAAKRFSGREQPNTYSPPPAPFNASMNKVAENAINSTRRK